MTNLTREEKLVLINSYDQWWHSIDFGDDVVSNGSKSIFTHNQEIAYWFPADFFQNKRVLDVGAWDGFYSFYAEKMGAKEVVAVDKFVWEMYPQKLRDGKDFVSKKGFDIAHKVLNSKVKSFVLTIEEMHRDILGTFDSIIFAGILYHMKNPYNTLEIMHSLLNSDGRIMIETHMTNTHTDIPLMEFHPKKSLNNDETNYWSPNGACVAAMLKEIGDYEIEEIKQGGRGVVVARKI